MRDPYPRHGRRWTWRHPLSWSCRCGLEAYPCFVENMWATWHEPAPRLTAVVEEIDELGHVRGRRHWSGGLR